MGAGNQFEQGQVELSALLAPSMVCTRAQALERSSPIPAAPGVYGWYFDEVPSGVPTQGVHLTDLGYLLYLGIAPRRPRLSDGRPSKQHLRSRIRSHFGRSADSSTLRLTLGALLSKELDLKLQASGGSGRLTFGAGEADLSNWMAQHARVAWVVDEEPWLREPQFISKLVLPLNLDQNEGNPFRQPLSEARRLQRERARASI